MKEDFMFVKNYKQATARALIVYFIIVAGLNVYLFNHYRVHSDGIEKITCVSGIDKKNLLIYTKPPGAFNIDFSRPIVPRQEGNKLVFDPGNSQMRNFRLYISENSDSAYISNITIQNETGSRLIGPEEFTKEGISFLQDKKNEPHLFSNEINAYFELKYDRINTSEFLMIEGLILVLSLFLAWYIFKIFAHNPLRYLKPVHTKTLAVSVFITSVFLPLPIFNVTFILSFALIALDFDYRRFIANKGGLLFVAYFLLYLVNDLFVSDHFNSRIIETLLPVLFLPFYFASTPRADYFRILTLAAVLYSLWFFSTSLINAGIYNNLNYFSFDAFTKYVHPVYFSYLLFFCLIYIELVANARINKIFLVPVLIIALLCCGSKLIIILTVVFYATRFSKKRTWLAYLFIALLISSVLLFSPTKNRFRALFATESLSVLDENPVKSPSDPRLNGLTLRLIIWQESLNALSGAKNIFLGIGVDKTADEILENRLTKRGLETRHTKYDPHNQFIATLYRTGIPGLFILLLICIYYYYLGHRKNDRLLFFTVILFFAAMLTESVLQRVTGVYFFMIILLLQPVLTTNTSRQLENSDTWNPGNS